VSAASLGLLDDSRHPGYKFALSAHGSRFAFRTRVDDLSIKNLLLVTTIMHLVKRGRDATRTEWRLEIDTNARYFGDASTTHSQYLHALIKDTSTLVPQLETCQFWISILVSKLLSHALNFASIRCERR